MAYAMLAGLTPVVGLYASTIPIIVYALFGSSRRLAVGPVAVVSLLVFAACSKLAQPGSKEYITIVLLLTLMVGLIQFLLGVLRLGFLPLFYHLPNAVLAAIITVAVLGLVEFKEAKYFLKVKRSNGFALLIAFAITLVFGVVKGVLAGVGFSLFFFIWRSSHPHAAELGYAKAEDVFRDIGRYPDAETYPNVIILRVDASLYFANMKFLDDLLRKSIEERPEVKWVVFDLSGVNDMDAVAAHTLEEIMGNYGGRGINFAFAGMKGPVRDLVTRAGWNEKYGEYINYFLIHHALQEIGAIEKK